MLTKLFAALLTGVLSLGAIFPQLLPSQNAAAPTPQTEITAQQAQSIALDHAGLKADQVTRLRAEKDRDDGVWVFDVEFRHGGFEYEYEIHAQTGKILRFETNPVDKPLSTQPPVTEASKTARLTEAEVRDIALKDAGLTKDQVSRLRVDFDDDDGVPEYDVEFWCDGWEYEYEIHAETGKIRSRDKDRDH